MESTPPPPINFLRKRSQDKRVDLATSGKETIDTGFYGSVSPVFLLFLEKELWILQDSPFNTHPHKIWTLSK